MLRQTGVVFAFAVLLGGWLGAASVRAAAPEAAEPLPPYAHIYQAPLFGSLFAAAPNGQPVDESALRYYASLRNEARVKAEIRRLKALHPNWEAPANIYSAAGSGNDEQPFWDLLAAGRIEELRAGIAVRMKNEPGWRPSRDLSAKIERKEAISKIVQATDGSNWRTALEIADADPSILHCAYMDANWRVAEAFLQTGLSKRAFEIYRAILATCSDHDERLTTVRKAIGRFSVEEARALIAMGAKSADGASEFDPARIDLTRARVAAVNSGRSREAIEAAELSEFFAEAERARAPTDLALAGWFDYGRGRFSDALRWFSFAPAVEPPGREPGDVKFAEGRALSLMKLGEVGKALRIAFDWRKSSDTMLQTYLGATVVLLTQTPPAEPIPSEVLADFVQETERAHAFEGAQALGWFHENRREWDDAAGWFRVGLRWKGLDIGAEPQGNVDDPRVFKALEGYAAALANLGKPDEALKLADIWRGHDPALRALFVSLATSAVNAAGHFSDIDAARLDHFTQIVNTDRSVEGAQALGWLQFRSHVYPGAIAWFEAAVAWSPDGKGDLVTNQGLALAYKEAGRWREAEDVAWSWRRQSAEMLATYMSSVIAELAEKTPLAQPRLDRFIATVRTARSSLGAKALGWHRLREGNCSYAAPWFRLASSWSSDGEQDAKLAEGLTLSLSSVGDYARAEEIAYRWRDRSPTLRAAYFRIGAEALAREAPRLTFSEARLARFAAMTLEDRVSLAAQALAWRRYREAGCGYGLNWFRLATLWASADERDAKMDEGYGLALRAVGRLAEAESLAVRWADKAPAMQKLAIDAMVERLSRDNPPEPVEEERLTSFAARLESGKNAFGAQGLGWYRLERGELVEAAKWFKNAVDWWPQRKDEGQRLTTPPDDYRPILAKLALVHGDYRRTPRAFPNSALLIGKSTELYVETVEGAAKTFEGYALTLRAIGRVEEAERVAYAWRRRWDGLRRLFIDIAVAELGRQDGQPLADDRLQRYVQAISEERSPDGASAFGWRFYAQGDFERSVDWFKLALEWSSPRETPDARAVEGGVLALRKAKRQSEALALAERWRALSPRLNVLYLETSLASAQDSPETNKFDSAKWAEFDAAMEDTRSVDGALSIAWLAYGARDYERASAWFAKAIAWSPEAGADPRAIEGAAAALRALGRYEALADFARSQGFSTAVRPAYFGGMIDWLSRTDSIDVMSDELRDEFQKQVVSERLLEGAEALGWNGAARKQWQPALDWFGQALAFAGVDPAAPPRKGEKLNPRAVKTVEGYVRALRGLVRLREAEDLAFLWRERADALHGLYLEVVTQELADPAFSLSPDRLERFAGLAESERSPVAASAIGWAAYRVAQSTRALVWFEKAMAWSANGKADPKIYEGYALTLRLAQRFEEAETFAWARRHLSKELRAAYEAAVADQLAKPDLAAKLTSARIERFAELVRLDGNAAAAQALGWRRLQEGNCGYAAPWFRRALRASTDTRANERASLGLAQSLRAVGMFNEAEDAAAVGLEASKDLRALYTNIVVEELTRPWPRPAMDERRIARFTRVTVQDHSSVGAQALGWRRYGEAGCGYGGDWFRLAAAWASDKRGDAKLNEGFALSQRAVGRLALAESIVQPWIETQPFMKKLYIDVAVEELSRDYPPEPMPEPRVAAFEATITPIHSALGAQALGWYREARGEYGEAAKWFRNALDWWPRSTHPNEQKLSAPVDDYQPLLARLALRPEDYRRTPRAYPNSSLLIGHSTESYVESSAGLAKTVEGYVMTLAALSRFEEGEALAWEWRDRWPRLRALFIELAAAELAADAPIPSERIERMASAIEVEKSARGAEALAWRSYGKQDFGPAARWFKSALAWSPGDADASARARLIDGYARALRGSNATAEALSLLETWRDKLPGLTPLYIDTALDALTALDPASPLSQPKVAEAVAAVGKAKSPDGAARLGWVAYERKEWEGALAWFRQAIVWTAPGASPEVKALEGYARTLQAEERFTDFMTFAAGWSERVPSLEPLYVEAAAQTLSAAAAKGEDLPTAQLVRAGAAFAKAHSVNGAQALAWQRVGAKDWVAAAAWFQAARDWSAPEPANAKIVEGLILSLRNLHRDDEAEDIAFAGSAKEESLREIYIEIVADRLTRSPPSPPNAQGMQRFAATVLAANSANGAQALGWYSYNAAQPAAAAAWFEKSLAWQPTENAALGLARTYRLSHDKTGYARVVAAYRNQFGAIAELEGRPFSRSEERRAALETNNEEDAPSRRASAPRAASASIAGALNAKDYAGCVKRAQSTARAHPLSAQQSNALGWCLMNLSRMQESLRAFEASLKVAKGKSREEAAYGKSLALLASGQAVQAGTAAAEARLTASQRNEMGVRILERRAWDAYAGDRCADALQWLNRRAAYAPETRDLMQMRATCLSKLGEIDSAAAITKRLDAQLAQ